MGLKGQDAFLDTEDFGLVFFQFGGDITLGVGQGLLAYPGLWHLVFVGIGDFQIVAKDIVVAHLQRADACQFHLALLETHEVFLSRPRHAAQLVQLGIHAGGYHTALLHLDGRVFLYLAPDAVADFLTGVQTPHDARPGLFTRGLA